MIDISVIIVAYNSADVIERCLSEIRTNADSLVVEVILIDNNSQDNTLPVVRQFSSDIKSGLILHIIENQNNYGYTYAVNQGLKKAGGKIIMLLNPDVFLTDGFLTKSVSLLNEGNNTGFIAPQHISLENKIIPSCREFPDYSALLWEITLLSRVFKKSKVFGKWRMCYFDHTYKRDVDQPMGACLIGKKETVDKIGLMDERFKMFFSDVDWCRRCAELGLERTFNPDIKVHHIVGHSVRQRKVLMILSSHYAYFLYLQKYFNKRGQKIINYIFGVILFVSALLRILFLKLKLHSSF